MVEIKKKKERYEGGLKDERVEYKLLHFYWWGGEGGLNFFKYGIPIIKSQRVLLMN